MPSGQESGRPEKRQRSELRQDTGSVPDAPRTGDASTSAQVPAHPAEQPAADQAGPSNRPAHRGQHGEEGGENAEGLEDLEDWEVEDVQRIHLMEQWAKLDDAAIERARERGTLMKLVLEYVEKGPSGGQADSRGGTRHRMVLELPQDADVKRMKREVCRHVDYLVLMGQVQVSTGSGQLVEESPGRTLLSNWDIQDGSVLRLDFKPPESVPKDVVEPLPEIREEDAQVPLPRNVERNIQQGERDRRQRAEEGDRAAAGGSGGEGEGQERWVGGAWGAARQAGEEEDFNEELHPTGRARGGEYVVPENAGGKKRWTMEETLKLIHGVKELEGYGNWVRVARFVGPRNNVQCKDKWRTLQNAVLQGKEQRGLKLTDEMVRDIRACVAKHGKYLGGSGGGA